jgi:uncharacterized protein
MSNNFVLIIFVRNLVYGNVKTRLAATIGNDKALEVYKGLIAHTQFVTGHLPFDKIVYYSDYIGTFDAWNNGYRKAKQQGRDLGERMKNAFEDVFRQGYAKAVIIGTDCPLLTQELIHDAFNKLNDFDIVIGPAVDGGYYLLGMKKLYPGLFTNIQWSTDTVFNDTIAACTHHSYCLLPLLRDIDKEEDLEYVKPVSQ